MAKSILGSNTNAVDAAKCNATLWTIFGPLLASLGVVPTREMRERIVSRRGAEDPGTLFLRCASNCMYIIISDFCRYCAYLFCTLVTSLKKVRREC